LLAKRDICQNAIDYIADVANEEAVADLFEQAANDFDSLDGLINNAGITRDRLQVKAEDGKILKKMSSDDCKRLSMSI
jgi:NAD(P)-dependent dehydrogenase (short-subunit alcohol dehydrogenase family)